MKKMSTKMKMAAAVTVLALSIPVASYPDNNPENHCHQTGATNQCNDY